MQKRIHEQIASLSNELKELDLAIYNHPELGYEEVHACAVQVALLQKHGFSVEESYLGMPTAYRAVYKGKKPGPNIAFLAEYDALPGLGHACGHNLIATVACGSAFALKSLVDEIGGNVYVFGCPAEETSGAKAPMADAGAFDDMAIALIAHPYCANACGGSTIALNALQFEFFGKPAHAAGNPWDGINALDGVINTFNMINALRQHIRPEARIHGYIDHGGTAPNIVPEYASAKFYVRAPKKDYLEELSEKVIRCAEGAALGCGARLEVSHFENSFDDLVTNEPLAEAYRLQLRLLGVEGPIYTEADGGSTDTGNVSHHCPAIHPWFDITGDETIKIHSHEFQKCAGTDKAFDAACRIMEALTNIAVRVITEPALLAQIREDFKKIDK